MPTIEVVIGSVVSGVFVLMWWDVRKIRAEFLATTKETDEKLEKKMSMTSHELICKNSALVVAASVAKKLKEQHEEDKKDMKEFKMEILEAIKKNGEEK